MMKKKVKSKMAKGAKMEKTMREYKEGSLHSGSKQGPQVKSRAQAIAIGLKQSGQSNQAKRKHKKRDVGKELST